MSNAGGRRLGSGENGRLPGLLPGTLLGALLALALPAVAAAHADLVSSSPAAGARVTGPPAELVLTFDEDLDSSRTRVALLAPGGRTVTEGGSVGSDAQELRLALPVLGPGSYTVRWTSFSAADGELHRGELVFAVVAPPASPSITAPATSMTSPPSPTSMASPSAPASATASASLTGDPSVTAPASPAPSATPSASPGPPVRSSAPGTADVLVPTAAAGVVVLLLASRVLRRRAR